MSTPILSCKEINLTLNGIPVLSDTNLDVLEGSLHLLIGENGSGKSSLISILSGVHGEACYSGTIKLGGKVLHLKNTKSALEHGIITLYQETWLYENLTIAENLFLSGNPLSSLSKKIKKANQFLGSHNFNIDSSKKVCELNLAQRRIFELIRLYLTKPVLLILDEPLASLSDTYIDEFISLLKYFKDSGTTILCATHYYHSLLDFSDYVTVLRDGRLISTLPTSEFKRTDSSKLIWGQFWKNRYPKISVKRGKEVLSTEGLSNKAYLRDVSLALYKGEILGIAGLVGAGKSMLAKTIFGMEEKTSGTIYVDRLEAAITSPEDAIALGLAYVTDERMNYGIFPEQTALENVFSIFTDGNHGFLHNTRFEYRMFKKYAKRLNLKIDAQALPVNLSGGEQQKLLLMRWLMSPAKVFIFDEPTQSLDIASKIDTYNLFNDLILKGAAIMICSSNLEELAGICDRIIMLEHGQVKREVDCKNLTSLSEIL